jgi:hypothetical protein
MLSQPATKIFLRTSEPHAATWISETIGEIEIERMRESRSKGKYGQRSFGLERQVQPLVMPSEISGLPSLRGYLKLGNLVVRLQFPVRGAASARNAAAGNLAYRRGRRRRSSSRPCLKRSSRTNGRPRLRSRSSNRSSSDGPLMLTISKPLSAGQARRYHEDEFQNARENYYTKSEVIRGVWGGELAARWGLAGEVREEHFQRLAEGQHPLTRERLVRHQTAREATNVRGERVTTIEHRAGWDATFSAPKSVSLTALVGGDNRVREAHRESVRVALSALKPSVQARLGGNRRPETTGNAIAAVFEHDSAQ